MNSDYYRALKDYLARRRGSGIRVDSSEDHNLMSAVAHAHGLHPDDFAAYVKQRRDFLMGLTWLRQAFRIRPHPQP